MRRVLQGYIKKGNYAKTTAANKQGKRRVYP